jgi:hypothetical protein
MTDELEFWTYSGGNTPYLLHDDFVEFSWRDWNRPQKVQVYRLVLRSEIYEKRAKILLTYQRETVKNKLCERTHNLNNFKVLERLLHL